MTWLPLSWVEASLQLFLVVFSIADAEIYQIMWGCKALPCQRWWGCLCVTVSLPKIVSTVTEVTILPRNKTTSLFCSYRASFLLAGKGPSGAYWSRSFHILHSRFVCIPEPVETPTGETLNPPAQVWHLLFSKSCQGKGRLFYLCCFNQYP